MKEDYLKYSGKFYRTIPGAIQVSLTANSGSFYVTFRKIISITSIWLRTLPTNGVCKVFFDELGAGPISGKPSISMINIDSVNLGGASLVEARNYIYLNAANSLQICTLEPIRSRTINLEGTITGTYVINFTYIV